MAAQYRVKNLNGFIQIGFSELCITKIRHEWLPIIILFNGKVYDSYDFDVYLQKSSIK